MANLAAYDIAKAVEAAGLKARLACYTFGAPRTGNHAFAWDYRETVPDTWGLINDQVGMAVSLAQQQTCKNLFAGLWQALSPGTWLIECSGQRASLGSCGPSSQ